MYPYGHLGQTLPSGQGIPTLHGYAMPSHQIMHFGGPSANTVTSSPMPTIQAPYPTGIYLLSFEHKCHTKMMTKYVNKRSILTHQCHYNLSYCEI